MFWTTEKLAARIRELEEYRYRDARQLQAVAMEDPDGEVGTRPPVQGEWKPIQVGDTWVGRDRYLWIRTEVEVPSEWRDRTVVARFDFGKTGEGNNSGFESLLYVNGVPYQGVDSNHQEVFFPDSAGKKLVLCFRLWSGLEGGGPKKLQEHKIRRMELAWLDEFVDELYYKSKAVLGTIDVLGEDSATRIGLLKALNNAYKWVDWSKPGSARFYDSVYQALHVLREGLSALSTSTDVTVRCLGHTHIDVAWLWRLKHTREKAARSFSTVLRLMERYPEYVFLQTQPQLYEYIKQDYPELYEQIRRRVAEGRWEADGAMWVEADCNLTSGESLVRQILFGTQFFRNEFGVECKYLWLPDVFGYSWALPQILRKSGIEAFMTTKISWNQYNRMPHDTFIWRGIDGSEVMAHFITTPEVVKRSNWRYTYNGEITPKTVKGIWEEYRDKELSQELLLCYGYGDGGGGVNREMLEMRRQLERMPGLPRVTTGRADEFFAELQRRIQETNEYVHTWDGELYLEYHRGTYTSQAYNKRMNRKLELLYRNAEWLSVMAALKGRVNYPRDALREGWKIILRNQFHDILPGSSIREVYEDSRKEYEDAHQIATSIINAAYQSITDVSEVSHWTVMNGAPFSYSGLVAIQDYHGPSVCFHDLDGHVLPAQRTDDGWLVEVQHLPAMGVTGFYVTDRSPAIPSSPFRFSEQSVETPYYLICWDDHGHLTRIYDKENRREVLASGERGNVFQVFEDKPLNFDAWDIDIFYQEKMKEVCELLHVDILEKGPLRACIQFHWTYLDSTIKQKMYLYRHTRRIDFHTIVDWHERQHLLKVAFPVAVRATEATYDIQFGNVKRPTHWNTSWDLARFETVAHQWVDLSEYGYGVSLLNDCKYGHDVKDNVIRLSLIKSAIQPDTDADQGLHEFTYALFPHRGDWREGRTAEEAWILNDPPRAWRGKISAAASLIQTDAQHVMVDAVKLAEQEDRFVIRIHDYSGGRRSVSLWSDLGIESWQECDLMERPIGDIVQSGTIECDLGPYEIRTFLVKFDGNERR